MRYNKMNKFFSIFCVIVAITALLAWTGSFLAMGYNDETTARRVLSENGYKNVVITGPRPLMRGRDDIFSTGFEATSPNGSRVTGAVCSGYFKGATIRFD